MSRWIHTLDPAARADGACAYLQLTAVGIGPDSSMEDVLAASFELQRKGALTPERRRAWDTLRDPAQRLLVDALLWRCRVPAETGTDALRAAAAPVLALVEQADAASGSAGAALPPLEAVAGAEHLTLPELPPPEPFDWP